MSYALNYPLNEIVNINISILCRFPAQHFGINIQCGNDTIQISLPRYCYNVCIWLYSFKYSMYQDRISTHAIYPLHMKMNMIFNTCVKNRR